ncbi:MAG TPA: Dickkopf N-terminal cysteine-rich domain-containing protein [Polyangiaceae bacterium]|jgi:hypothetical protein|nr:Dickkopf N-terminal cysteine-rich domain-containing protein [Polyangiaceae bacterium]
MSRFLVSALAALALSGCVECSDRNEYECVRRYDPYFGYYDDCHLVRNQCPDHRPRRCTGANCACTVDTDCASDELCSAWGTCVSTRPSPGSDGTGQTDASASGAHPGAGGASGAPLSDSGPAPKSDAGTRDAGAGAAQDGGIRTGSGGTSGGASGANGGGISGAGASSSGGAGRAGASSGGSTTGSSGGAVSIGGSSGNSNGASGERVHRLDFACIRDTQCGAGQCTAGLCYLACESDTDCGTADRCSVETGRRLCMIDPNPPVRCDESAICRPDQTCVNGACHDPCNADGDCANLQDRCVEHLCFPDRRPIAECVLNVECAAELVCLDGRCVKFGDEDGGSRSN